MGYRPEPSGDGCFYALVYLIIAAVIYGFVYFEDIKPHKKFIKHETKPVLDNARERAISAVDTINIYDYYVDVKSAKKDSVKMTRQMLKIMDSIIEDKRYNDYKADSVGRYIGNGRTVYGVSSKFNINKAMKRKSFAITYQKYYEAIKQLEIARRQEKRK